MGRQFVQRHLRRIAASVEAKAQATIRARNARQKLKRHGKVLAAMEGGARTVNEILQGSGLGRHTLERTLREMRADGLITLGQERNTGGKGLRYVYEVAQ